MYACIQLQSGFNSTRTVTIKKWHILPNARLYEVRKKIHEYIANIDFDHKDNAAPNIVLRSQQRHWVGE